MALIKIGTAPVRSGVERIDKASVEAVRGIVNGVAVSVRAIDGQSANAASYRSLQCMIDGRGCPLQMVDVAVTREIAE